MILFEVADDGAARTPGSPPGQLSWGCGQRPRTSGGAGVTSAPGAGTRAGAMPRGPASAISVLIVDDHPVVRQGCGRCWTSGRDIVVAGEAGDGPAALGGHSRCGRTSSARPEMPAPDGIRDTRAAAAAGLRVLVLGAQPSMGSEQAVTGRREGLHKDIDQDALVRRCRSCAARMVCARGPGGHGPRLARRDVTPREREVPGRSPRAGQTGIATHCRVRGSSAKTASTRVLQAFVQDRPRPPVRGAGKTRTAGGESRLRTSLLCDLLASGVLGR